MRLAPTLLLAATFGLAAPAVAEGVDNGLDVLVNPSAASPHLLYPGQSSAPIHLHMPTKRHRTVVASKAPAAPVDTFFSTPAEPKPKPAPKPKKVAKVEPAPAPQQQSAPADSGANPYFSGSPNLGNVFGAQPAPAAKPAPKKQLASAAPSPATPGNSDAGLTKRSVILFAKDAADPAEGALKSIGFLATDLNAAMSGPGSRVELQAYGGNHGDKGSDARRAVAEAGTVDPPDPDRRRPVG